MGRLWVLWGIVFGFLFIALGAFGAHGLSQLLPPEKMETLDTANLYMGFHALALILLGLWNLIEKEGKSRVPGLCFLFGILIFSGSLYVYVLAGLRVAAMITPLGGTLFLLGWIFFGHRLLCAPRPKI